MWLEESDLKTKSLYYQCGECTLLEFVTIRAQHGIYLFDSQQEVVFILDSLMKMFATMHSLDLFYSDLKPENVVMRRTSAQAAVDGFWELRLVEFGSVSLEHTTIAQYTPYYALPDLESRCPFGSKTARIKAENYTIGRTMMYLMLTSTCAFEKIELNDAFFS